MVYTFFLHRGKGRIPSWSNLMLVSRIKVSRHAIEVSGQCFSECWHCGPVSGFRWTCHQQDRVMFALKLEAPAAMSRLFLLSIAQECLMLISHPMKLVSACPCFYLYPPPKYKYGGLYRNHSIYLCLSVVLSMCLIFVRMISLELLNHF